MASSANDKDWLWCTGHSLPDVVPFPNFGHGPNRYSVTRPSASQVEMEEEKRKLKFFPFYSSEKLRVILVNEK